MNNFIRGSQVVLHKIRMFWQAVKILVTISIIWVFFSFFYNFYGGTTSYDWYIFTKSLNAKFATSFNKPNKLIEIRTPNGSSVKISARFFDNNYFTKRSLRSMNTGFESSASMALRGVGIILALVIGFFCWRGHNIKRNRNLRGSFLTSKRKLKRDIEKHNKVFEGYKPCTIVGMPYAGQGSRFSYTSGEQSHTLLVGSTGSGKTKIIKDLLFELYERRQKAIIIDVKGDYIKNFYCKKNGGILLNPMDERGVNWNIWQETDALKGFQTIAKSLIPRSLKGDPIWNEAAAAVFTEMAKLYWNHKEPDKGISLSDFADKILTTDLRTLENLLKKTPASKLIDERIDKAALSVLMVLCNYLLPLKLYKSNKDCFSITKWVQDDSQRGFLFISSLVEAKDVLNPIVATQVAIAVNAIRSMRTDSNIPKIHFVLDELSYFSDPIANLQDGLTTARSSGGCFVLGTQDMSSLEKIYGHNSAKTFANNCKTKLFLSCDNDAADWCSKALGEGEVEEWHESLSYGSHQMRDGVQVTRNKTMKRVVLPSEFTGLKTGQGYIKVVGFNPSFFKAGKYNWLLNNVAEPFIENHNLVEVLTAEIEEGQKYRRLIEEKLAAVDNGAKVDPKFALKKKEIKEKEKSVKKIKKLKEKTEKKEQILSNIAPNMCNLSKDESLEKLAAQKEVFGKEQLEEEFEIE